MCENDFFGVHFLEAGVELVPLLHAIIGLTTRWCGSNLGVLISKTSKTGPHHLKFLSRHMLALILTKFVARCSSELSVIVWGKSSKCTCMVFMPQVYGVLKFNFWSKTTRPSLVASTFPVLMARERFHIKPWRTSVNIQCPPPKKKQKNRWVFHHLHWL